MAGSVIKAVTVDAETAMSPGHACRDRAEAGQQPGQIVASGQRVQADRDREMRCAALSPEGVPHHITPALLPATATSKHSELVGITSRDAADGGSNITQVVGIPVW